MVAKHDGEVAEIVLDDRLNFVTNVGAHTQILDVILSINAIRPKPVRGKLIIFRTKRFSEDELLMERMLLLSAEAVEKDW